MKRIKIATIDIFVEDCCFFAKYTDEAGGSGHSDEDGSLFLEDAVAECIEYAKKTTHDAVLMDKLDKLVAAAKDAD